MVKKGQKNLDKTIDNVSKSADNISFFVLDIVCIKKAPFKIEPMKEDYIIIFVSSNS